MTKIRSTTYTVLPGELGALTADQISDLVAHHGPVILVWPIGCHTPFPGDDLPLGADAALATSLGKRVCTALRGQGHTALLAPTMPYGVRDIAESVSDGGKALAVWLEGVISKWLHMGFAHVCLLDLDPGPAQTEALERAVARVERRHGLGTISLECAGERVANGEAEGIADVIARDERRWSMLKLAAPELVQGAAATMPAESAAGPLSPSQHTLSTASPERGRAHLRALTDETIGEIEAELARTPTHH